MIRRITLKDFMSHRDTSIELNGGVTVLTGPNNIGKSAVVEALRCVVENPASQELIRHGASKAVVSIELDSGEVITWERTPTSSRYKIFKDGREEIYAKVGNNVPEDVKKLLRISPVITGDNEEVNVHIALQKDPIFIPSGSRAAGFFAASTEAHYLIRMQQILKTKADIKKARRKEIEEEVTRLQRLVEAYLPLDTIGEMFSTIDRLETEIKRLEEAIPLLLENIEKLEITVGEVTSLKAQYEVFEGIKEPPPINNTVPLKELVNAMTSVISYLNYLGELEAILEQLESPPEIRSTGELYNYLSNISALTATVQHLDLIDRELKNLLPPPDIYPSKDLSNLISHIEELERERLGLSEENLLLSSLKPFPDLRPIDELRSFIGKIKSITEEMALLGKYQEIIFDLKPPPELKSPHEITALRNLITNIGDVERKITKEEEEYAEIERLLQKRRSEIEEKLRTIRICPLCNQPITG
ncbi:MAG: AAA family ATPase [Syntrophobacterales bacterium]|nr:AAA family ATPase [Syntrophobacterales bacterium]